MRSGRKHKQVSPRWDSVCCNQDRSETGICFEALEPRFLLSGSWGAGADAPSAALSGSPQATFSGNTAAMLGLAISRNLARALGGDISAASLPGRGSTFRVTLATGDLAGVTMLAPEQVSAAVAPPVDVRPDRWQLPGARVLIVDDGAENRELLRLFIEEAGAGAAEDENGEVGVAKTGQTAHGGQVLEKLKSLADAIVPPSASQGSTAAESAIGDAQIASGS